MYFEPTGYDFEIPVYFRRFFDICDFSHWEKRFASFSDWRSKNPFIGEHLVDQFPIELALLDAKTELDRSGQFPQDIATESYNSLLSFVAMVIRVHQRSSTDGKKRIEGILRGGLKGTGRLSPFAHEMAVAAHLLSRGFEVYFNDLEEGNGFDFLATKEGKSLEVECKHISGDVGRKIHKRDWLNLVEILESDLSSELNTNQKAFLINITIPRRLETGEHRALRKAIVHATRTKNALSTTDGRIEVREFNFAASPFSDEPTNALDRDTIVAFLEERFAINNPNAFAIFNPPQGMLIFNIRSDEPDTVLKSIVELLKKSSKDQLTGNSPGVICALMSAITGAELHEIANNAATTENDKGTGLQWAANYILRDRPNVQSLAFMTFGNIHQSKVNTDNTNQTSIRHFGHVYEFSNENFSSSNNSKIMIF